jgi:hypothetical protein
MLYIALQVLEFLFSKIDKGVPSEVLGFHSPLKNTDVGVLQPKVYDCVIF